MRVSPICRMRKPLHVKPNLVQFFETIKEPANSGILASSGPIVATTCPEAAAQRAAHLARLGAQRVLELCVGPSLATLRQAYAAHGLTVTGNDIDPKWQPDLLGHCFTIDWSEHDTIVFAPPLSRGCTGRREDALTIGAIQPRYVDFLRRLNRRGVLVLPARSWATSADRRAYYEVIACAHAAGFTTEPRPLIAGRRQIRKYIDVYLQLI